MDIGPFQFLDKARKVDKWHGLLPVDFNHGNNFQVQKVVLVLGPGTQVLFCTKISMVDYVVRMKKGRNYYGMGGPKLGRSTLTQLAVGRQHIRFKFDHVEGVRLQKGNTEHG
jgi:hypothetical protein